jgi:hypothetical protein
MAGSDTFVFEMEEKNRASFQRLMGGYTALIEKEAITPAELVRLEMKVVIEAIEVAAMWLAEADSLEIKLQLASRCGDGARHCRLLRDRLAALGVDPQTFDARFGGYSKLFAFFRSLQTTEEQAAAGAVTLRAYSLDRLNFLAGRCEAQGDPETAALFRDVVARDEDAHRQAGRQTLLETAINEESQARARRSAFRTIELLGELQDASLLRKYLTRSMKR